MNSSPLLKLARQACVVAAATPVERRTNPAVLPLVPLPHSLPRLFFRKGPLGALFGEPHQGPPHLNAAALVHLFT
jgi:hypothetical protein